MTGNKHNQNIHSIDQVAQLLRQAQLRAPAPQEIRERAFEQLHAHWSRSINRQRKQKHLIIWGMAASTLIALGVVLTSFDRSVPQPVIQAAEVVLTSGEDFQVKIPAQEKTSTLTTTDKLMLGAVVSTGDNSRITLRWGQGGSLRVAENTQFEIIAKNEIRVMEGRVYFDSTHERSIPDSSVTFSIATPFGNVTHIGTQFITQVADTGLHVFVRDGQVKIVSTGNEWLTEAGNALEVNADGTTNKFAISRFGADWQWVQDMAPAYNSEGRTAQSLLNWISRETGYTVEFESQGATNAASGTILHGMNPLSPLSALQALPVVTNLTYELLDGTIFVREEGG